VQYHRLTFKVNGLLAGVVVGDICQQLKRPCLSVCLQTVGPSTALEEQHTLFCYTDGI
jgi:hypothetical protein